MVLGVKQCINTYCLHSQGSEQLFCEVCGASLIVGDYLLVNRLLGSDNPFSSSRIRTFEATSLETGEEVILRVVHSDLPLYVQPLQDTAIALSQIHSVTPHPGLMQLFDDRYYFTWQIRADEPPAHFLVAKKVLGVTLRDWLDQNGPALESIVIEWLKQLLHAVDALHRLGFIHRDIKPDNIVVTHEQKLVLIDFDTICRLTNDFAEIPAMGTPTYMAPEQAKGHPRPASDFFSIGKTAVELLTGKKTFEIAQNASGNVDWAKAAPHVSLPLAELVDKLASDNTMRRPADVEEAYEVLAEAEALLARKHWLRWPKVPAVQTALLAFGLPAVFISIGAIAFSQTRPEANAPPAEEARPVAEIEAERLLDAGTRLILRQQPIEGITLIEQALELEPESGEIRAALGLAYAFLGDYSSAIENYKLAIEIEPENSMFRYELADVYEKVDLQKAAFYYVSVMELGEELPFYLGAANNLARVYLLNNQLQEADEVLSSIDTSTIEDLFIKATVLKNLAWLNYERGNFEGAEDYLSQSLEADPTQPDAYCISALVQREQGEDNYADKVTCINLRDIVSKSEVDEWRQTLLAE